MKQLSYLLVLMTAIGCGGTENPPGPPSPAASAVPESDSVVVYASLDREFSEPLLQEYGRSRGLDVDVKYDVESTKSVGLTTLLIAEAKSPRCDLFWNNEILNTLRLRKRGLLASWTPKNAESYPAAFKDAGGQWYGLAARARILIANKNLVSASDMPTSIFDLTNPKWKGKIGIAKPLAGTTATHAVCLFQALGAEKAKKYFSDLKANDVRILSGNKQVAIAVGAGELAFGMTDTDDAVGEIEAGRPVSIVYPDRKPDQLGTLFIPNTLAILKDAPHRREAELLGDYLLGTAVEEALAKGPSAQIPLNSKAKPDVRVETPATVKSMSVDFEKAVDLWEETTALLAAEFGG